MIDPTDKHTKDLFELLAEEAKYAAELCGMTPAMIIAMDFSEAEQRAFYAMTLRLIDSAVRLNTGRFYGKSLTQIMTDDCLPFDMGVVDNFRIYVDDLPYALVATPRKAKKAQWKNERSVFNRVNQGRKSK